MTPRTGLVFVILPLPVIASWAVATAAGFLGAGIPGGRLAGLGVAAVVVEGGVRWGSAVGALVTFAAGIGAIWGVRRRAAQANAAYAAAPLVVAGVGCITAIGALLGAGLGAHLVARLPFDVVLAEVRSAAWLVASPVVVGVAMGAATGLVRRAR